MESTDPTLSAAWGAGGEGNGRGVAPARCANDVVSCYGAMVGGGEEANGVFYEIRTTEITAAAQSKQAVVEITWQMQLQCKEDEEFDLGFNPNCPSFIPSCRL
jgi:hypothetical protein